MDHGPPLYPYTELTSSPQVAQKESTPMSLTSPASSTPPPPITTAHLLLGPENTVTACPFCHATVKTAVKYTNNTGTHIAAALCGMICCCCCIPYCSDSAKNTDHYCPNCQKYLGTYRK